MEKEVGAETAAESRKDGVMSILLSVLIVALAVGLVVFLLHALAGPDPPDGPSQVRQRLQSRDWLFRPEAWKKEAVGRAAGFDYRRPMNVELPNDGLLAPPRVIEGANGEQ
jgi:hypothetical protein